MGRGNPARQRRADAPIENAIENDSVFPMIGREAPLDFFRKSGVHIRGDWTRPGAIGMALFVLFILEPPFQKGIRTLYLCGVVSTPCTPGGSVWSLVLPLVY